MTKEKPLSENACYDSEYKFWYYKPKDVAEAVKKLKEDCPNFLFELSGTYDECMEQKKLMLEFIDKIMGKFDNHSPLSNVQERNSEKVVPSNDKIEDTLKKDEMCECGHSKSRHGISKSPQVQGWYGLGCYAPQCSCKKFKPLKKGDHVGMGMAKHLKKDICDDCGFLKEDHIKNVEVYAKGEQACKKFKPLKMVKYIDFDFKKPLKKGCGKEVIWCGRKYKCGQMEDLKHSEHIILCPECEKKGDEK